MFNIYIALILSVTHCNYQLHTLNFVFFFSLDNLAHSAKMHTSELCT